ncbi:hypothetical protein CYPRO_3302 [Cyclonatronum proteinivorum]|uniref:Uncharacterized protein n=1 Tax=Cyclonatronum proteinivorum TaxID=1457365 RepID=A0A345UPY3_9BACT|nr:hypothetical protein CYPRO_3302 [Cyclonatronum proteinivorum]
MCPFNSSRADLIHPGAAIMQEKTLMLLYLKQLYKNSRLGICSLSCIATDELNLLL